MLLLLPYVSLLLFWCTDHICWLSMSPEYAHKEEMKNLSIQFSQYSSCPHSRDIFRPLHHHNHLSPPADVSLSDQKKNTQFFRMFYLKIIRALPTVCNVQRNVSSESRPKSNILPFFHSPQMSNIHNYIPRKCMRFIYTSSAIHRHRQKWQRQC